MKNLKELYKRIIPPNNYLSRKDFYNDEIIDNLDKNSILAIENMLIEDLKSNYDILIIETLAYIRSIKSTRVINQKLNEAKSPVDKIIIAWCLYSLGYNKDLMIGIADENFSLINDDYEKTMVFYYLSKFNDPRLDLILKSYIDHNNILLSHNSKIALETR